MNSKKGFLVTELAIASVVAIAILTAMGLADPTNDNAKIALDPEHTYTINFGAIATNDPNAFDNEK